MMILYQADVTEFLQEFKVFSHLSVCPRAGHYEDIHTREWSHSDSQTQEILSRPTWHLSRSPTSSAMRPMEHLTPFSDLDSAEVSTSPEPLPLPWHCCHCHSVTVVHLWLLRKHRVTHAICGARLDGPNWQWWVWEAGKLAGIRLRSKLQLHFVDGNIQRLKVAHRMVFGLPLPEQPWGFADFWSSPLTGVPVFGVGITVWQQVPQATPI